MKINPEIEQIIKEYAPYALAVAGTAIAVVRKVVRAAIGVAILAAAAVAIYAVWPQIQR